MDLTAIIKEIARGPEGARDLDPETAERLYGELLDERVPELESGAVAIALRMKGESEAELAAFLAAIDTRLPVLELPAGALSPVVVPTYNGARRGANLTPLVVLALCELGVPVLVHGLEESFGRVTSAEILDLLGVPAAASPVEAIVRLHEKGCAFLPTAVLLPGLAAQLNLRARLGLRNCAHSLVKMLDPISGGGVVLASATHPPYLEMMRRILSKRRQRALLFRGGEGEPYANPQRCPRIEMLVDGTTTVVCDAEVDSLRSLPELPLDASASSTARWISAVLEGLAVLPRPLARQLEACLLASGSCVDLEAARLRVSRRFRLV